MLVTGERHLRLVGEQSMSSTARPVPPETRFRAVRRTAAYITTDAYNDASGGGWL
jgi:hypothetical protein